MIRNQNQYAIWDLDNCLSDDRSRVRLIDWKAENPVARYAAYHAACALDPCRNIDVFHAVSQLARPVFFTARPESVRIDTTRWVRCELDIEAPIIFMRPDDNIDPSVHLKRLMLESYIQHQVINRGAAQPCYAAFDDREDIVDMYRSYGIPAALLSIHSVCAYTAPKASK